MAALYAASFALTGAGWGSSAGEQVLGKVGLQRDGTGADLEVGELDADHLPAAAR